MAVIPEPWPVSTGAETFSSTPKAPAGALIPKPEFTWYQGTNSGPYKTTNPSTTILPPIPIEWIISPRNVFPGQCPTGADTLRLFGITNLIVLILIIFTGSRPVARFLTRKLLGRPLRLSRYRACLLSFALQVGSNAVIAHLIVSTPGYEHLSRVNIFLAYSSRPRINQIWTGLLRLFVGVRAPGYKTVTATTSKPEWQDKPNPKREDKPHHVQENPANYHSWLYTDTYTTTSLAELPLQLISTIFIGITWRRFPNDPIRENMKFTVDSVLPAPALVLVGWLLVPIWLKRDRNILMEGGKPIWITVVVAGFWFGMLLGTFAYGAAWMYWSGFLMLPGSLWCPPKLGQQAVIWSMASGLSALVGASV